jgi:hypothetical protein
MYDVTTLAKCWRVHECVECGCVYRYLCAGHVTGSGTTTEIATERAKRAATEALAGLVDDSPCPQCGLVQPYVIAARKYRRHLLVTGIALALAGIGVGIAVSGDAEYSDVAVGMLLVGAILAVLCHFVVALRNPSLSRANNLRVAQKELASGRMQLVQGGETHYIGTSPRIFGLGHIICLLLAGAAVAVAIAPGLLGLKKSWHQNEDMDPSIITPGDTVHITFPDSFDAALGQWAGWPTVTIENEAELGEKHRIKARSQRDPWDTITGTGIKNETVSNLWADLDLPPDPSLGGKTLSLNIYMPVLFRRAGVVGRFTNEIVKVSKTVEIHLSPVGAREQERQYRLLGTYSVAGLIFVSGLGLAGLSWSLRQRCSPGVMEPFAEPGAADSRSFDQTEGTAFASEIEEPAESPAQPNSDKPWYAN